MNIYKLLKNLGYIFGVILPLFFVAIILDSSRFIKLGASIEGFLVLGTFLSPIIGVLFLFSSFLLGFKLKIKNITLVAALVISSVLSLIVLSSAFLSVPCRSCGKDAAIKSNLANMRAFSIIYYVENNDVYRGFCADTRTKQAIESLKSLSQKVECNDSNNTWAMSAQLRSDNTKYWCVDGTGKSQNAVILGTKCVSEPL